MNIEKSYPLPFAEEALDPIISPETVALHYKSHHLGYLHKLNELIHGTQFEYRPLEEIIPETHLSCEHCCIFNNAAQAWNHAFFWKSLCPVDTGRRPVGDFLHQIVRDFGSFEALKEHLLSTAAKRFGSGWLWLVRTNGRLVAYTTPNAETPLVTPELKPLLTIDLWEHAYYLDWHNRRANYVEGVIEHLIDWTAASERFASHGRIL